MDCLVLDAHLLFVRDIAVAAVRIAGAPPTSGPRSDFSRIVLPIETISVGCARLLRLDLETGCGSRRTPHGAINNAIGADNFGLVVPV